MGLGSMKQTEQAGSSKAAHLLSGSSSQPLGHTWGYIYPYMNIVIFSVTKMPYNSTSLDVMIRKSHGA